MNQKSTIHSVVMVALFAALTFIGTNIRIPLPTGAFVHLGNAILLLAVLLIGYKKGALAGGLGFAIFDILNGYATEAPYFILESFIVGGAAYLAYAIFNKNLTKVWQIMTVGVVTGIAKVIMTQLKNTAVLMIAGSGFPAAFGAAFIRIPATIINVCITLLIVSLVYFPLKQIMGKIFSRQNFSV